MRVASSVVASIAIRGLSAVAIGQHAQHPGEYFAMRIQIDQPSRARDRRVIRVYSSAKCPQSAAAQRVRQPPGNPRSARCLEYPISNERK